MYTQIYEFPLCSYEGKKNICRCATDHMVKSRIPVVDWRIKQDLWKTDVTSCREDKQIRNWPNIVCKDINIWHLTLKECLVFG